MRRNGSSNRRDEIRRDTWSWRRRWPAGPAPRRRRSGGYDLTFSPVKSVSTLWAIANLPVAAQIEQAHHAAVAAALRFLEDHALYTREGTGRVRQVNVTGLVVCSFIHRDSRTGDPDLHTHVANKVQTLAGRWLSIDGRILHAAKVAASETYNTAREHHLTVLGVRFAERPGGDRSKRPVREIVGVDPRLNQRWSTRRQVVGVRKAELAAAFARDHGRPPGRAEMLHLAQQATLETRDRKHEPRTLTEQRSVWRAEAVDTLGGPERIDAMIDQMPAARPLWRAQTADRVLATVEDIELADLWTDGGCQVLGLAPSAAAAAQLAEATGITADTLARLTWALDHHRPLPDWADRIGPRTLLLIDEAGLADTPTLDTAISHTLRQGGPHASPATSRSARSTSRTATGPMSVT
jgi:conjugative relaxase-like TrwC/TraI family protein